MVHLAGTWIRSNIVFYWFIPHWWPQFFLFTSNTLVIEYTLFSWHIAQHIHSLFFVIRWKMRNPQMPLYRRNENKKYENNQFYALFGIISCGDLYCFFWRQMESIYTRTRSTLKTIKKKWCVILIKFSYFHSFLVGNE